ncbi:MAG: hypothetical protein BV458_08525 [Thermoplasmata archaeon M9B2D]|nr:MAG: hypothetical protein BV458_08525 [Thermoplasmata archaeon M9B2D]
MTERVLPSPELHTLFVSREVSHCPLIAEILAIGKTLQTLGLPEKETGIMSLDYGKRLLINAKNADVKTMTQQDVVEIVDYDPLKNIMMVIGATDPSSETPVHWIIQKARHDINVLLQINSVPLFEKWNHSLPATEKDTKPSSLERAKELLRILQKGRIILIKNEGIVFGGINVKEIHDALHKYLGGFP